MNDYKFGNFIYTLRSEKGISQEQLGQLAGVSNSTVSKWENGKSIPPMKTLKILSEYFGVTSEELLNGERTKDETIEDEVSFEIVQKYDYDFYKQAAKHPFSRNGKFLKFARIFFIVALASSVIICVIPALKTDIGMGLIAILMNLLLFASIFSLRNRSVKRQFKAKSEIQKSDSWELTYQFGEKIVIIDGENTLTYSYSQFGKVTETDKQVYLWIDKDGAWILQKNSFIKGNPDNFVDFLQPKLGPLRKSPASRQRILQSIFLLLMSIAFLVNAFDYAWQNFSH